MHGRLKAGRVPFFDEAASKEFIDMVRCTRIWSRMLGIWLWICALSEPRYLDSIYIFCRDGYSQKTCLQSSNTRLHQAFVRHWEGKKIVLRITISDVSLFQAKLWYMGIRKVYCLPKFRGFHPNLKQISHMYQQSLGSKMGDFAVSALPAWVDKWIAACSHSRWFMDHVSWTG